MNNFYATKRSGKTLKIAINTALLFFALIVSGNSAFAQCPIGIPVVKNISSGSNVNMALSAFPSFPAVSYQWIATSNPNVTGESLSIVSSSLYQMSW